MDELQKKGTRRGMATLEVLLVLMTFTAIWAGTAYLADQAVQRMNARAQVRECAWRIAARACRFVPEECESTEGEGNATDKTNRLEEEGRDASFGSRIADVVQDVLLEQLRGVFAQRVNATASVEGKTPEILGGNTVQTAVNYSLPCNTRPVDLGEIAEEIFKDLKGGR